MTGTSVARTASPRLVLALSLLGISFAGPLVRLSSEDPLAIAVWRLCFSLIIVAVALGLSGEWRQWRNLSLPHAALAALSGTALAFHFWAWNASIHLTTIAASVTLVSLQPVFVAAISAVMLREAPSARQIAGIGLAIFGAVVIASQDFGSLGSVTGSRAMLGNLLATSAAVTAAIYYTAGRHLRGYYGLWAYVGLAYTACAIVLVVLAIANGTSLYPENPQREFSIFIALAIGPMLLGHTGMNWALKYLPAYIVNLVVLGEPIGATLLGAVLPGIGQIPSFVTVAGGAIILAGVLVAATAKPARSPADNRTDAG